MKKSWAAVFVSIGVQLAGQTPSAPPPVARRSGGFVPGQKRPPGDPAQVARGNTLYEINCRGCHGADLRGGDMGGPNLLRSQVALSDQNGELIVPIIQGSRQDSGMPAIALNPADSLAVAAYVRSIMDTIGSQGKPPSATPPPTVLVGNAADGQKYFEAKCGSCHSVTGDLQGIGAKFSDAKALQNSWMTGGDRRGRFRSSASPVTARTPMVTITFPSGEKVEGQLVRIDDFLVTAGLADGTERTIRREGAIPKVEVRDPMKIHRDLWAIYTDKDMHDVTAYLATIK